MLDTKALREAFTLLVPPILYEHGELDRLLAAATVDARFCDLLLQDPNRAVQAGFQGESFQLSSEEAAVLFSINAYSLAELAEGLARCFGERPQVSLPISAPSLEYYGR